MEKIPTAEQFLISRGCLRMACDDGYCDYFEDVQPEDMIEFARIHVEAALKAKGLAMVEKSYEDSSFSISELDTFTQDSYPLENII